ncbi:OmpA family protein [Nitratifractor salsuginis]|uniref:OmpA/MotB domain protein n=1 Tax=Nitratifractor salsuginis (strain DSM 16511 / JCM 12458 / E9I37-1) TaxID=749222 RepID=E6X0F1_NITSE|nr:OmpA family protein [Nitratifractor salsuginis]ADV46801.1 OmpA/MotB domain protein [Nitratifractor salsuginis DSM 16511]
MRRVVRLFVGISLFSALILAGGLVTGTSRPFAPGDKVLYRNDFRNCPVGEIPEGFNKIDGAVECVKFNNHIWVANSAAAGMELGKKIDLGAGDFSIDFNVVPRDAGEFNFFLYENDEKGWDKKVIPKSKLTFYQCGVNLEGVGFLKKIKDCYEKPQHVALQVRRGQMRFYINGKRAVAIPWKLEKGKGVTGFGFEHRFRADPYGYLISDLRVAKYTKAEAKPTPEQVGIIVRKTSEGSMLTVPEKVLFDFNKFILKPEAKKALDVVADYIRSHPARQIVVTGYTDNIGTDAYNLRLSLQRAQSVADYLMDCGKVDPKLFKIVGKGKANPIADNATEEGRAKNRRVEIRLIR